MPKIECRTIHKEEAEEFLGLLCEVFELDIGRAASVFFSEPFFALDRKFALFCDGVMTSILTTTPLEFGIGRAVGIAGVATRNSARGLGYAERLLDFALEASSVRGEGKAVLFAHQETVYKRAGFETLDVVIKGPVKCSEIRNPVDALSFEEVTRRYAKWERSDDRWLRRDERRWKHWQWVYRSCEPAGLDGYYCYEPMLCREALVHAELNEWPVVFGTEWFGLRSITEAMGVPIFSQKDELLYMGRGFDEIPWMFMTDQF